MKVSKEIAELVPYKPGKPISETLREYGLGAVIKLASNENPLGVSPKVTEALQKAVLELARYPDPTCFELITSICQKWSFPREWIAIGNGSDELFDQLIRIYCEPGDGILVSQAAFSAYQISAQAARAKTYFVPMKSGMRTDLASLSSYLEQHRIEQKIRLVFIPNPNNPTGTYVPGNEVETFLSKWGNHPELLILFDEAYTEFVRAQDYREALLDTKKYSNVMTARTLSKVYGLAGLRVGILFARPEVVDLVNRVRKPFNINELAQVAAIAALQDHDFVRRTVEMTWEGLDYFYKELQQLELPFLESQGNFVLFDTLRDASKVNEGLLRRGLILRPVANYGFPRHLRMSVGTMSENRYAIKVLKEVLGEMDGHG